MKKVFIVTILTVLLMVTVILGSNSVWRIREPLWIIEGQDQIGGMQFEKNVEEKIGIRAAYVGGYPLTEGVEKHLNQIRNSHTIFFIDAGASTASYQYEKLEEKYPELCPMSYEELVRYPLPLVFFARGTYTFMVRGIVIAKSYLGYDFANVLINKNIPLNTVFRYQSKQLIKSEEIGTTWEEKWETLSDSNLTVKYKPEYKGDAKNILRYAIEGKKAVHIKFPYPFMKPITIYLYNKPREPVKGYSHASASQNPPAIHFVTPSVSIKQSSYYAANWYKANIVHEYTHLIQHAILEEGGFNRV